MIKKIINNDTFRTITIVICISISVCAILLSYSMTIISEDLTNEIVNKNEEIVRIFKSLKDGLMKRLGK